MQYVDGSGMHFQQATIRVTTRAEIEMESAIRFLSVCVLRIKCEAQYPARREIPRQATERDS